MYTFAPFFRYCSAILQRPSLKITPRCHSVFSLRSPVALSRQLSDVARLRLAIGRPSWVRRISGSLPRFPTKITLFTLPAIAALHYRNTGFRQTPSYPLELWHCLPWDHLEATLYASHCREPDDPSVIHI